VCGEMVLGAMAAYTLACPGSSTGACGAGTGGATAVVMVSSADEGLV
jgi:hypothetical protein